MSNEQAIMDKFVAKSLEIIALKETNRELLDALQLMVRQFTKTPSTLQDTEARVKAHKAISKALGEPS